MLSIPRPGFPEPHSDAFANAVMSRLSKARYAGCNLCGKPHVAF